MHIKLMAKGVNGFLCDEGKLPKKKGGMGSVIDICYSNKQPQIRYVVIYATSAKPIFLIIPKEF